MRNSCAVCSLAVVLCLVVCVSATVKVTRVDAEGEVTEAKAFVKTVRARAQTQLNNATNVLGRMDSANSKSAQVLSQAEPAETDYPKAKEIADQIKILSAAVAASYSGAKGKLETAVSTLSELLEKAKQLDEGPVIEMKANEDSQDDFTDTKQKGSDLKTKATDVDNKITEALREMNELYSTANEMEQKAKEAQLKSSHVSVIVSVSKIETMLRNADTTIGKIEGKKNAVSGIVGEMQTLKTNHPHVSDANIEALHQSADNALRDATGALDNANSAREAIQIQKGLADAVLKKVQPETQDVNQAEKEVQNAEACVTAALKIVPQLEAALLTATNSVTSANNAKENLKRAVSTATSATRPDQSVTQSQVKQLKDSVSADVNRVKTIMEETDGTLPETKNKKEEVNNIVQEMKTLSTTDFIEANMNIKVLYKSADDALADATDAVKNAEKAKTDMTAQKQKADAALSRVETATDVETAQKEVDITNECVNQVNQFAGILKSALLTATNSVTSVTDLKKKLENALSTTTTALSTFQATETEKTDHPVVDGTEPDQKDTTVQPTSKDSPDQTDNSADKVKEILIKGAQNVPTTALTGVKAPAPGAKNDSAMTVSVQLLVALIAPAALQ